jgi:hypothetical protein
VIPLRRHVIVVGFNSFQYAGNPAVTLSGPDGAGVIVTWGTRRDGTDLTEHGRTPMNLTLLAGPETRQRLIDGTPSESAE